MGFVNSTSVCAILYFYVVALIVDEWKIFLLTCLFCQLFSLRPHSKFWTVPVFFCRLPQWRKNKIEQTVSKQSTDAISFNFYVTLEFIMADYSLVKRVLFCGNHQVSPLSTLFVLRRRKHVPCRQLWLCLQVYVDDFGNEKVNWRTFEVYAGAETQSYDLKNLVPNSYYQLVVRAHNNVGWSDNSPVFVFQTAPGKDSSWY